MICALQAVLRSAQDAGIDRESDGVGKTGAVSLGHMCQGAQHGQVAFLVDQFRRHGCKPPIVEQVQHGIIARIQHGCGVF